MSISLEAFGIDRLDIEDRYELLRLIVDSFPPPPPPSPELIALLRERVADAEANPDDGISHEQMMAELDAEFGE